MTTVNFQLGGTLKFVVDEPEGYALFTTTYEGFTITAKGHGMAYKLPNDKFIAVKVAYADSRGNPAAVDGDVTWESSDESVVTVVADAGDSTSAKITPVGPIGQAQISCTADADLGEGVREIITTADIDVVAGEAVAGTIAPVGEPQPIPEAGQGGPLGGRSRR
jgi:hypothetical protein